MEGDTKSLSTEGEAQAPVELEGVAYDERDRAVIRATQGDLPVVPEPYVDAAAQARHDGRARCSSTSRRMKERGILRRVAAILFHRRAGFSANGMGVWKVPDEHIDEIGPRMASFRGISHCYQRPTYEDWPYSVFTMAHGRSKEECDAILDAIADEFEITERATLYSSTEFKKIRLLYFTDDFKELGTGARRRLVVRLGPLGCRALDDRLAHRHALRRALRARARLPARRRELAGARDALDRPRPDLRRPRRGRRAHRRRPQPLRRLGLLVGPAHPRPRAPRDRRRGLRRPRSAGRRSARRRPARSTSPRRSAGACPACRCCA